MKKKGYKRVKIEENNTNSNNENINPLLNLILEKNIIKITLVFLCLIIIFSFIAFYLISHKKENIEINEVNTNINNEKIFKIKDLSEKSKILTEKIENYEKTLRIITMEEIREFRRINDLNISFDRTKYKRTDTPDISIIITMRNQAHCIYKAIRSVQNQSLKNIEMIIIDDCSLDNSTEVVENLMKEDDRIILLKHDNVNKGVMITRNEGIRMAKGKYISILDADDTFLHKDILKYSLNVANMADLDVVEFLAAFINKGNLEGYYHYHGNNPIIYQPELREKFYEIKEDEKYRPIKCRTVWGKIVKNEVFQKALKNIPKKYLNDYILEFEDTMITVSLYQVAQSYYGLKHAGYYYTFDEKRNRFPIKNNKKCQEKEGIIKGIDHIKFLQFLIDKLDDNNLKKQIIYHEVKAINNYTYSNFKRTITHHFSLAYSIFEYLLNGEDLNEQQKEKLRKIKDEIKENEKNSK